MSDRAGEAVTLVKYGSATARGFHARAGLTFDEWISAGRQISRISTASAWWVGDWLLYGERAYGSRYRAALELTPFDYKTLRNYAWVARRFQLSRRRDALSFQHHAEVASLPEPEQDLWLSRAEAARWTRNELRRQLAARRATAAVPSQEHVIVVRIRVAREREEQWRVAAEASSQPLAEWVAAAADVLASTEHLPGSVTTLPDARHRLPAGKRRDERGARADPPPRFRAHVDR
jgi:hypothetical protein